MKCRRICRELLWLTRFGELGPSSQPHLDHLAGCLRCRDEVGFDRAMVEQLRLALAERVANASPSPTAWDRIRERASTPEPRRAFGLWSWSGTVLERLRFGTAMAGTGLALVVALNMEIVPVVVPASTGTSADEAAALEQVPRMPPPPSDDGSNVGASGPRGNPEPLNIGTRQADDPSEPAVEQPQAIRIIVRTMQTPDPGTGAEEAAQHSDEGVGHARIESEPGRPS